MAVTEQTPYIEYTGNGSTTSFPLTFDCDNADHLIVTIDGVDAVVGSWSLNDGNIIFTAPPANKALIALKRSSPVQRSASYQQYDNSFRPAPVNKDFDKIWIKLQELGVEDWLLWRALAAETAARILAIQNEKNERIAADNLEIAARTAADVAYNNLAISREQGIINSLSSLSWRFDDFDRLIELLASIKNGANGWTDLLISLSSGRTQRDKNNDELNLKDFGAKGDGITDDTTAIKNAINAAILLGKALYIPASTQPYMFRKAQLAFTLNTAMSANRALTIYGDGAASCLKMFDGEINTRFATGITLTVSTAVNAITFKDLKIDMNARGSTPPTGAFDYEQSAAIKINTQAGATVETLTYDNVVINDPAADGFNDAGSGIINNAYYLNVKETNRTRTRASILLYQTARNVFIQNPAVNRIETEAVSSPSGGYSRIYIQNGTVDILDLGGYLVTDDIEFFVDKLKVKLYTYLAKLKKFSATESDLRLNDEGRLNQVADFSAKKCKLLLPYLSATNSVAAVKLVRQDTTRLNTMVFDDCDFLIDYVGALPSGYTAEMVSNATGTAILSANVANNILIIKNSRFDARATVSVAPNRMGTVELINNKYAGTDCAVKWFASTNYATDLTIDGGNFANATIPLKIGGGAPSANHRLLLRGLWLQCNPAYTTYGMLSGTLTDVAAVINNSRTMPVTNLPISGIQGDVYALTAINQTQGAVSHYRCITSSTTTAKFCCDKQNGLASYITSALPVLTLADMGARAIDTTMNTVKTWTGSAWA